MNGPQDPVPLLRALSSAGVEHIVIGGFAVISYGVVRVTQHLDICPAPDRANLERSRAALLTFTSHRSVPAKHLPLAHLREMQRAAGRPQDLQDLADLASAA